MISNFTFIDMQIKKETADIWEHKFSNNDPDKAGDLSSLPGCEPLRKILRKDRHSLLVLNKFVSFQWDKICTALNLCTK